MSAARARPWWGRTSLPRAATCGAQSRSDAATYSGACRGCIAGSKRTDTGRAVSPTSMWRIVCKGKAFQNYCQLSDFADAYENAPVVICGPHRCPVPMGYLDKFKGPCGPSKTLDFVSSPGQIRTSDQPVNRGFERMAALAKVHA
jgi:hypothetical protein